MAEGDGQRIGGIIGARNGLEAQQCTGHLHNLHLLGAAIADHRLLDLQRCILINRDILLGAGQQDHAAGMAHLNAGGDIGIEKQLLNSYSIGLKGLQQGIHILIDLRQPLRKGRTGRGCNGTMAKILIFAPVMVDHAVTNSAISGVNT